MRVKNLEEELLEQKLVELVKNDTYRMAILTAVHSIKSEELWIAGGFVRNLVWDNMHNYVLPTELGDIDIFYFNKSELSKEQDIEIEKKLLDILPNVNWSVKNQARMHIHNNDMPYLNLPDALSRFPETASAIAVRLRYDKVEVLAPTGLVDLFELKVKPTTFAIQNEKTLENFKLRYRIKLWSEKWPLLKFSME